ncbi:MAG: hypothetical protein FWD87_11315 [Spirochaetaceae bacterium]|nr:hypothetical protein [Spirochaetaceae bacterium]
MSPNSSVCTPIAGGYGCIDPATGNSGYSKIDRCMAGEYAPDAAHHTCSSCTTGKWSESGKTACEPCTAAWPKPVTVEAGFSSNGSVCNLSSIRMEILVTAG